jgi:hypothetical protein
MAVDVNQILVWAQVGGQLIPVIGGAVTNIAAVVADIRATMAQHGLEADNATLDAIIADDEVRQNRAKQQAEKGPTDAG